MCDHTCDYIGFRDRLVFWNNNGNYKDAVSENGKDSNGRSC